MGFQVFIFRRVLAIIAATGLIIFTSGAGLANQTNAAAANGERLEVISSRHIIQLQAEDACGGGDQTMTIAVQAILKVYQSGENEAGKPRWSSLLQAGTFFIQPAKYPGVSYAGTIELQKGDEDVQYSGNHVFVARLKGLGSDGSRLRTRLWERVDVTSDGFNLYFVTPSLSTTTVLACG